MKVEVGYAYYNGNAQVWDTLYVPIRRAVAKEDDLGDTAVAHLAQEAALLMLEQRYDADPIVGTFLIGVDEDCAVECPECGAWEAVVEKATLSATGDVFFPDAMLAEDGSGFAFDYDGEDRSTEDEIVRCARCGHRGPLDEFTQ